MFEIHNTTYYTFNITKKKQNFKFCHNVKFILDKHKLLIRLPR